MPPKFEVGRYRAKFIDQGFTESKNGTPQFFLRFELVGQYGDRDGELYQCDEGERTIFRSITEKTFEYLKEDLQVLGFSGGTLSCLDLERENHHSFIGQEADVYCKHESYQGQTKERWQIDRPRTPAKPLEGKKLRELDALFGAKLKQSGPPPASNGGQSPSKSKAEKTADVLMPPADDEGDDSGIPF